MMIRLASAGAIAALMSTAAMAQSPNTPMMQPAPKAPMAQSAANQIGGSARLMATMPANGTTVTNYYKRKVYDPSDHTVGDVRDLIVEKDGRISAAIIGAGGFLGIDEKNVVLPFDDIKASQRNNVWHLTVNTTKADLRRAPGFKFDHDASMWISDKSTSNADHKAPQLADTKQSGK
jgi:sporulation protein YlmC with PRC-barrel domain